MRQLRFHGVHRQVFVAPLMHNSVDHLLTGADPQWTAVTVEEVTAHWKARWALPRSLRDDDWRRFDRRSWRLYLPG